MSRIGRKPILIPAEAKAAVIEETIIVNGPKGELKFDFSDKIQVQIDNKQITVSFKKQQGGRKLNSGQKKKITALWGLTRTKIYNMIKGVVDGYEKNLEFEGLGYRANVEANGDLVLFLGYSHDLRVKKVEGIEFVVQKNVIKVSGFDKELVGQTASTIKKLRKPDAYKGKGVRYQGEIIKKKPGKKASTATK